MLWGIVTRSNVDYAELLWEEFVQAIQIFYVWAALNIPTKKPTPHVILYCRFIKLIIYYLGSEHNIHRRPRSPVHVTGDDFLLGNIKFVPKGEKDEGEQKKTTSKADKPKKHAPVKQLTLAEQTKLVKEKTSKPTPSKKIRKDKVMKVRKEKRSDLLVDEEDEEPQPASEPQVEDDEYNLQRVVEGKGKGIATDEQVAQSLLELQKPKKQSTTDQYIFQSRIPATQDAPTEPSAQPLDEVENVSNTVALEERTIELDEGQARSDPDNPLSSSGTLLSMKNIDDGCTFGDQFLNDKPTEEEPGKANVETEVESMVTVPFYQASSSAPPLSTPIIDLTPLKPVSPPAQEPIFTATTTTTITLLPPPPPPQQNTTDPVLAAQNHDLYSKIDNYVNETVKKAIHNALQVPIRDHFRELSEFEMKEILHDRMFESGSYQSHSEHSTLYEALEASMDRENREEFIEATAKSLKRRRDDQDPPLPPPKDSDQNKKKRHDSDASASKQPPVQNPSAWKTYDIREAPSNSSKQKTAP
ncbi:hypothetical protein Tco_0128884 [Tanacetum coccineum]